MNIISSAHYRSHGLVRWPRPGGLLVLGAVAAGALALAGSWLRAQRHGVWVQALLESDDFVISLALPIPLSLLRRALAMTPISDDDVATARTIIEDPELLKALHEDAIEITAGDGADHIEVVIGPRRRRWRVFQFNLTRSFSRTKSLSRSKELHRV